jgi:hypothetical protein
MCCDVFYIEDLDKARDTLCNHCEAGKGCGIYEQRPKPCIAFHCAYLTWPHLDERWKPANCKFILVPVSPTFLTIRMEKGSPDAWREEPFYSVIKGWAAAAHKKKSAILIRHEDTGKFITGNGEINVGPFDDTQPQSFQFARDKAGHIVKVTMQ